MITNESLLSDDNTDDQDHYLDHQYYHLRVMIHSLSLIMVNCLKLKKTIVILFQIETVSFKCKAMRMLNLHRKIHLFANQEEGKAEYHLHELTLKQISK